MRAVGGERTDVPFQKPLEKADTRPALLYHIQALKYNSRSATPENGAFDHQLLKTSSPTTNLHYLENVGECKNGIGAA